MTDAGTARADRLLARFPKARPGLPPAFQEIYAAQYKANRSGETTAASLSQRLEAWMHRKVAEDVADGRPRATLELGAGTLTAIPAEGGPSSVPLPLPGGEGREWRSPARGSAGSSLRFVARASGAPSCSGGPAAA